MGKRTRKPVTAPKVDSPVKKTRTKAKKSTPKKPSTKKTSVKKTKVKNISSGVKTKKVAKAPKKGKKATPSGPKGYTVSEYQRFLTEKERLGQLANAALKEMLRKNLQSMSGNKDDLVLKVADGIVLGRIPRCPNCFGGRPKYDYKTGVYTCPGYRDD